MPLKPVFQVLETGMKPELRPPGGTLPQGGPDTQGYRWLWLSLAAVLLLGLLVIFALPGIVGQPQPAAVAPVPTVVNTPAASAAANQAMQDYLQLRAKLELENVSRWGEPDWSQATAAADSGARLLAQRQFAEAAASYTRALQTLEQLYAGRAARLAAALAAAEQALAANAIESAVAQFERALAIEPEHAAATRGLARAAVRLELLQAMRTGEQAESNGEFAVAQLAYQQAVSLDGEYEPAVDALVRVTGRQQEMAFRDAMTRTLTALDAGQLNTAGKALAEAAQLQPDAVAVTDAQQRLAQARQQARLSHLRRDAATQVASEHWQAAADLYAQALSVDNSAGFARDGLARARERVTLHARFDHYLDKPERIYSAEPLANAQQLLTAASAAPAGEPVLARKVAALQALVTQASTPVAVNLSSDGETEVAIYHVGKLGRFTRHRLELLPGSYTVVGSRNGYRDVRKLLPVSPGSPAVALLIKCEEQI
jgi:tetratricopeptide (TPR) repeat protein